MELQNNLLIKNIFKRKEKFLIFNTQEKKTIDVDIQSPNFPIISWHTTFNQNQYFTFEIQQSSSKHLFGYFISVFDPTKVLSVKKNKNYYELYLESYINKNKRMFQISINNDGYISIKLIQDQNLHLSMTMKQISSKVQTIFNTQQNEQYEWLFIRKDEGQFNNKEIIIYTNPQKQFALSNKTGQRFLQREVFSVYDKQNYTFKAKCNNNYLYTFLQSNGQYYISSQNEIAMLTELNAKSTNWSIIQNILVKDANYFLSMDQFYYLQADAQTQNIYLSKEYFKPNQIFSISIFDNEHDEEENGSEDVESESDEHSLSYKVQQINFNQLQNKNNNNTFNQNQVQNINNNPQYGYPQMNQQVQNGNNEAQIKFLTGLYNFSKQDTQKKVKRIKLLNKGSGKYLNIKGKEIYETDNGEESTYFSLNYLNENEVTISISNYYFSADLNSPASPIQLQSQQSNNLTFVLEKTSTNKFIFHKNQASMQIIGGRLFLSQQKINEYAEFFIIENN